MFKKFEYFFPLNCNKMGQPIIGLVNVAIDPKLRHWNLELAKSNDSEEVLCES
jgi:hypothetical protein